jgi:hypothetical protein
MNELLAAIKDDLIDRRLRAVALLLVAALIAAIAYAASGGGGAAPAGPLPAVSPASTPATAGSITPVAAGTSPNHALAETPSGASAQRRGALRNPFTPLPGSTSALASARSKSGTSAAGKSAREPTPASTRNAPVTPSTPKASAPAKPTYEVSVAMGPLPPGTLPQNAQLIPYEKLKFQQKLPSPSLRLLAFTGVAAGGKKAVFKLIGEVIPRGGLGTCSPSPTQCQTIELEAGRSEELEYLPPTGPAQVYELQVVTVAVH